MNCKNQLRNSFVKPDYFINLIWNYVKEKVEHARNLQ